MTESTILKMEGTVEVIGVTEHEKNGPNVIRANLKESKGNRDKNKGKTREQRYAPYGIKIQKNANEAERE